MAASWEVANGVSPGNATPQASAASEQLGGAPVEPLAELPLHPSQSAASAGSVIVPASGSDWVGWALLLPPLLPPLPVLLVPPALVPLPTWDVCAGPPESAFFAMST